MSKAVARRTLKIGAGLALAIAGFGLAGCGGSDALARSIAHCTKNPAHGRVLVFVETHRRLRSCIARSTSPITLQFALQVADHPLERIVTLCQHA